jgi:MoaA/NifB/PqqE/SkfB family radical SAM enzyme
MKKGQTEIPIEKFEAFVDSVKSFRPEISLGSTEPLLYKDIIRAVDYVKKSGLVCSLGTNGFLLPKFAEELVRVGLDELQVSIDGPPEVHNSIRGVPGAFERLEVGIRLIHKYKKQSGKTHPKLFVNTTISEFNFDVLKETTDLILHKLKADNVTISHLNFVTQQMSKTHNNKYPKYFSTESCLSSLNLKNINLDVLFSQLNKIKNHNNSAIQVIPDLSKEDIYIFYREPEKVIAGHDRCLIPWFAGQITSNGDAIVLTRCFHYVFGNIYSTPFNKIWNGVKARRLRKDLLDKRCLPVCTRCCGVF